MKTRKTFEKSKTVHQSAHRNNLEGFKLRYHLCKDVKSQDFRPFFVFYLIMVTNLNSSMSSFLRLYILYLLIIQVKSFNDALFFKVYDYGTFYKCISPSIQSAFINPLNAELNPLFHLLALLGAHHILYVSRVRVKRRLMNINSVMTGGLGTCSKALLCPISVIIS